MRGGGLSPHDRKVPKFSGPLRASTGIWLYDCSVTPKHHDSKRKIGTWGQEPMQFTCSSFGQQGSRAGTKEGAIKILQINYTKKKKGKLFI